MDYFVFKYMWLIAILPKSIQFVVLFSLTIWYFVRARYFKLKLNGISKMFFTVNVIYIVSIIASIFRNNHEISRIFAAFNTCAITFIGVIIYNFIYEKQLNIRKVSKYMFYNMIILFCIWGGYLLLGQNGNFSFMNGVLSSKDWVNNRETTRFQAYLEYVNLIVYMELYCLPLSIIYVKETYGKFVTTLYALASFFPIISSNSRTGLCCVAVLIITIILTINFSPILIFFMKHRAKCIAAILVMFIFGACIFYKEIFAGIGYFLTMRQGSTDTRMELYRDSIWKMLVESPILGCGIKDTWKVIPYGSHSTYIGMFYKTGILGGTIFLCWGFRNLLKYLLKKDKVYYSIIMKVAIVCILGLSILEDLDGANWNIVMFMSFCAVIYPENFKIV